MLPALKVLFGDSSRAKLVPVSPQVGPAPTSLPRQRLELRGPPLSWIAGRSALAAAMSCAGVVLSQLHNRTTPSIGLDRNVSSTSMAIRFAVEHAEGFMNSSPSESVGTPAATAGPSTRPLYGLGHFAEIGITVVKLAPLLAIR